MKTLDGSTLEKIADLICGDDVDVYPVYRSGAELTRFFRRACLSKYVHDGSTRKWWTLNTLETCSASEQEAVVLRLGNPKEYGGDGETTNNALRILNQILSLEGYNIQIDGVNPIIIEVDPGVIPPSNNIPAAHLPTPDFKGFSIDQALAENLRYRWIEAEKCIEVKAHLSAIIMMGSLLEGLLLAVIKSKPKVANKSASSPKDPNTGKVKPYKDWTLSQMIDVAHSVGWIGLDLSKFSHALRDFRNLVHPNAQLAFNSYPNEDTCKICWQVVQAAVNALAEEFMASDGATSI